MLLSLRTLRSNSVALAIALLPLSLTGCASATETLRLSTGSTTGYYYRLGQVIEASVEDTVHLDIEVRESKGSLENLQQLLEGNIDMALVQLDVAQESMKAGDVEAIAVLAREHIHLIGRQGKVPVSDSKADSEPRTLSDLKGKTLAIGTPGSGIRYTAEQLLRATGLDAPGAIQTNESGFSDALDLLSRGQVDAAFYVGRLGANERLREVFAAEPSRIYSCFN